MKDTELRPGRPPIFGERLERVQVMLTSEQRAAAEAEASQRGVSVSTVCRDWMDAGRAKLTSKTRNNPASKDS